MIAFNKHIEKPKEIVAKSNNWNWLLCGVIIILSINSIRMMSAMNRGNAALEQAIQNQYRLLVKYEGWQWKGNTAIPGPADEHKNLPST